MLVATAAKSTPVRSVPPAATLANSTVTSAFVANFFTDFFKTLASKDVVRSIPVERVDMCVFSSDLSAERLSPSRDACKFSTTAVRFVVSIAEILVPSIAEVTSTLAAKFSILLTPSDANVDMCVVSKLLSVSR